MTRWANSPENAARNYCPVAPERAVSPARCRGTHKERRMTRNVKQAANLAKVEASGHDAVEVGRGHHRCQGCEARGSITADGVGLMLEGECGGGLPGVLLP